MSEESETNAEDATPAFFEDADAPDQEKEEFRRLDARERPNVSQEGAPEGGAAANASIHRGSRYEGGTDELTADIGAPSADQGNVEFEPPATPSDRTGDDTTPSSRNRSSQPVNGDLTDPTEDGDAAGATTRAPIDRPDQPAPAAAENTAPAPRESAVNAAAAGENQDEQLALNGSPLPSQSVPSAAAGDAEFTPVAQAPAVVFSSTTGNEDEAISLDLGVTLTDTDGNETLSIIISGVPEGAQLSGGTDNGDGTWTLAPADLSGLALTPPENFSGTISLGVTATAMETTGQTAVTTATADITVQAVADAPALETTDTDGNEDTAIALDIQSALTDTDGSETLSVTIGNIPEGSVLTMADGTVVPITGGTASLTPDQLAGLSLTPPADFSGDIPLSVTATSTDGTDTAVTSGTLNVNVTAVADAPALNVADASGAEDTAIALNIDAALTDSGETLSVSISNIPEGAVLTLADGTEVTITGGTATLTPDQLAGLNLTPPADFSGEIALDVVATSTDGTDTATTSGTLNVAVTAVADAPTLDLTDTSGNEDTAIALDIQSALTDTDGSETLSVSISNIPEGSILTLADGTQVTITGGTATLTPDQLAGLSLTPPADFSGKIALEVVATSTDGTDTATTSGTLNVSVTAVADAPTLDLTDASGSEDQAIALNIDAFLTDSGETLSVTIGNIPEGSILTLAAGSTIVIVDGAAVLTPDQLDGLSLTPPADFSGEIALDVVATSTDGTDTATTSGTLNVAVTAIADTPTLDLTDTSGNEDTAIALDIQSALTDTDGSETLSVSISNIPEGSILTLADGTQVTIAGGTATLTPDQLAGLSLTPPADFSGKIALEVVSTSTDGTDTATTSGTLNVSVTAVADAPTLDLTDASGSEDQAIALNIDASLTDAGETLSVSISNIPEGAVLTLANGTEVTITDGTATLTPDQLAGLSLTPPADFSGDIALEVVSTSTDGTDTATTSGTLNVSVTAVADAPTLDLTDASGSEDEAIALNIDAALTDSGETLSVSISNIPEGSILTLADGTQVTITGGTATLTPDQLAGLSLTPPADFSGDIALDVIATSTDGSDTAVTSGTLNVSVTAVADAPTLDLTDAPGSEDEAIALNIDAALTDSGETLSVSISNIPEGAVLTLADGTEVTITAGKAPLTPDQLAGLNLTPPADFSGDIPLSVTATSTDGTDTAVTSGTLNVSVTAVADTPNLSVTDGVGTEDVALNIDIDSSLVDGDEVLSISIGDIPEGSILATGDGTVIPIEAGVAILSPDQLTGLSLTPPANQSGLIELSVAATSTDGTDTATTTDILSVNLDPVADAPLLNVTDALGTEDQALLLDIDSSLIDNSEVLSVAIGDIPEGSILATGDGTIIPIEAGVAILSPDQLTGLSLTPPANQSGLIELSVAATSTDGADTATTTDILSINLDPVADGALLNVVDALGTEDQALLLDIDSSLIDNSEVLSVAIGDIPEGSILTTGDGTVIPIEAGVAILSPDQLTGLSLTPPENQSGLIDLTVSATSTDGADTATTTDILSINLDPVADAPTLTMADATGLEDQPIALSIDAALTDGGETLNVTIADIPEGALLTLADGSNVTVIGGTATLTPAQLTGLSLTPPEDFSGDIALGVTATSLDGLDAAVQSGILNVTVTPVADMPDLSITIGQPTVTMVGGTAVPTSITQSNYMTLDAGYQVSGRTINLDGTLSDPSVGNLTTAQGGYGVNGLASGDNFEVGYSQVFDVSEELIVDFDNPVTEAGISFASAGWVSAFPDNAVEQGHYDLYRNGVKVGEGNFASASWAGTGSFTAMAADGGSFDQIVFTASKGYAGGEIIAVGDGSDFVITGVDFDAVVGGDPVATYPIDIAAALTDTDGSESLGITLAGVPAGAVLSAGTDNGDGTWTLQPNDLPDLNITVPGNITEAFQLDVSATATESDGSTATATASAVITPDGPQNAPEVSLGTTELAQDFPIQPISFAADAVLSDLDGSDISQAVISISDGYNLGDILSVEGNTILDDLTGKTMISGTNIEVVGGGFDLTSNALTLQGADSLEAYQSVINSLTFNSLSPELIEGTRTISITVMDDTGLVSQTANLGVTLNDPLATDLFADSSTATSDPALAALSDPVLAETTDPATDWLTATETETLSTSTDGLTTETPLSDPTASDSGLSSDPVISDAPELTTI